MSDNIHVIEIIGEGKTDSGPTDRSGAIELPDRGVVPILVHRLCGKPSSMRVKRKAIMFLQQGKTIAKKVQFAKRQAVYNGSAGIVFVTDTEGDHRGQLEQLTEGRDAELPNFPAAIGVAHPCIEAWLLTDARALQDAAKLKGRPNLPAEPESLPAPCQDRDHNPKTVLRTALGVQRRQASSAEMEAVASAVRDLGTIRAKCPIGFGPFALEIERQIQPIFK